MLFDYLVNYRHGGTPRPFNRGGVSDWGPQIEHIYMGTFHISMPYQSEVI